MIFEENLEQLKRRDARLYDIITSDDFTYDEEVVCVEAAKNGEKIISYIKDGKSVYLNSRYNPMAEAEKYMQEFYDLPEKAILVMFGLANGDFLRAFEKNAKHKNIYCIVYEPCAAVFMQVMRNIDIRDLLEDEHILWVAGGLNQKVIDLYFRSLLQNYNTKTSKFMAIPKYASLFFDECKKFTEIGTDAYNRAVIDKNTGSIHGKRICQNAIMNLSNLHGARSEIDFKGKFPKELTAIVVAAGPSLEKNIDYLKAAKGKALIIAVDTAIQIVLDHDVMPDMIICIDMLKPLKYFQDSRLKSVPFLVAMDTNYEVLDCVSSDNFIFISANSTMWGGLFDAAGSMLCSMDVGGSVATSAIATLINWRFKRVILIGQDLAFTDNRIHAGEEVYEKKFEDACYRYVEGITEDKVLTRLDYYSYLLWIEEIGFRFPWFEIIDSTEGGAKKKNTTIMPFKEAIERYCTMDFDIYSVLDEVPRLFVDENAVLVEKALDRVKGELHELCKQAHACVDMCNEACESLKMKAFDTNRLRQINNNIWEFDQRLCETEGNYFIAESIQDEANAFAEDFYIEEEDDMKEAIRMYEKSARYYQAVAEVIPQIEEYMSDCRSRLDNK